MILDSGKMTWTGSWPAALAWLDELAGGYWVVPMGGRPPITTAPPAPGETSRRLHVCAQSGCYLVPVGGSVTWTHGDGFSVDLSDPEVERA